MNEQWCFFLICISLLVRLNIFHIFKPVYWIAWILFCDFFNYVILIFNLIFQLDMLLSCIVFPYAYLKCRLLNSLTCLIAVRISKIWTTRRNLWSLELEKKAYWQGGQGSSCDSCTSPAVKVSGVLTPELFNDVVLWSW